MRLVPGFVVALASLVACNPPPPAQAPACAPCPACASAEAAPSGQPPFASLSSADLPPRLAVTWRLHVLIGSKQQDFEVGSMRAGDVPLTPGSTWACRVAPVSVSPSGTVSRQVRCSADHWRTSIGDTGEVAHGGAPIAADVQLYDGAQFVGSVTLEPCTGTSGCLPAPELP